MLTEHNLPIIVAMICLAAVNIAALKYLELLSFFVLGASAPIAMKLLEKI